MESDRNFGTGRSSCRDPLSTCLASTPKSVHLLLYRWKGSTRRQAKGHHLYTPNTDKVRPNDSTRSYSQRPRQTITPTRISSPQTPALEILEALANTKFRTDGRPQVPRGAAKEEAERCHALSAARSLLGGTTHHHLKKSDIRRFVRLCLGVLVEHLLRVLSYSSAS